MSRRKPAAQSLPGREALLEWFARRGEQPTSFHTLMKTFHVPASQRRTVAQLLDQLVQDGKLVRQRGRRYQAAGPAGQPTPVRPGTSPAGGAAGRGTVLGRLWRHHEGFGFVTPVAAAGGKKATGPDIHIRRQVMGSALHGDLVEVHLLPDRQGASGKRGGGGRRRGQPRGPDRLSGRIVRVVERAHPRVVGRYQPTPHGGILVPLDERLSDPLPVASGGGGGLRPERESLVVGELLPGPRLSVQLVHDFGVGDDPSRDTDLVIEQFSIPTRFSAEVEREAAQFPDTIVPKPWAARRDLRDLPTVTIDGEQARDFDDAISMADEPSGYRLWVHIADVGHYVPWESLLDQEARRRGTSVYFPDRAVPMLPERLSNNLCSLNPSVDRLAVTVEMQFDRDGQRLDYDLYESVIRSDARLTYTGVAAALQAVEVEEPYRTHRPLLMQAAALAERLGRQRMARGSLDFDLPEPEIVLDLQGRPVDILKEERTQAHRLIEECMLAANITVAEHLTGIHSPMLYRIHEPPDPDRLESFRLFARSVNATAAHAHLTESASLQALLEAARGLPEERLLNHLLLRSMKRARYGPEPLGHFGLAAPCYTHFTSPIRRYPDLVVHRLLKAQLGNGSLPADERARIAALLPGIGLSSSERERVAMEAEWEVVKLKKTRFMAERIGDVYRGYITGVALFGLFVEPDTVFVEGLVLARTLPKDRYRYDEQRHRLVGEQARHRYQLGDPAVVQVAGVNLDRRQVNFLLVEPT